MSSRIAIQKEYDALFRKKPNKWDNPERSNFMIKILEDYIPNPKEVIDVGCGNGVTLENYRRHNKSASLYGIDPSQVGIQLAQQRVPDGIFTTEEKFTVFATEGEEEYVKQFDLVLCMGVAEHAEELIVFLRSLKEMIKPGGYCYLEVPNNLEYSPGPHTYRRMTIGSKQVEWHFPLEKWEKYIVNSGFNIVERVKGLHSTWEFIWILN